MSGDWKDYWFSEVTIDWSSLGLRIPREITETVREQNSVALTSERMNIAEARTRSELEVCIRDFVEGEEDPYRRARREIFLEEDQQEPLYPVVRFGKTAPVPGPYALEIGSDKERNYVFKVRKLSSGKPEIIGTFKLAAAVMTQAIKVYEAQISGLKEESRKLQTAIQESASRLAPEKSVSARRLADYLGSLEESDIRRFTAHTVAVETIIGELGRKQKFDLQGWEGPGRRTELNKSAACRLFSILFLLRPAGPRAG